MENTLNISCIHNNGQIEGLYNACFFISIKQFLETNGIVKTVRELMDMALFVDYNKEVDTEIHAINIDKLIHTLENIYKLRLRLAIHRPIEDNLGIIYDPDHFSSTVIYFGSMYPEVLIDIYRTTSTHFELIVNIGGIQVVDTRGVREDQVILYNQTTLEKTKDLDRFENGTVQRPYVDPNMYSNHFQIWYEDFLRTNNFSAYEREKKQQEEDNYIITRGLYRDNESSRIKKNHDEIMTEAGRLLNDMIQLRIYNNFKHGSIPTSVLGVSDAAKADINKEDTLALSRALYESRKQSQPNQSPRGRETIVMTEDIEDKLALSRGLYESRKQSQPVGKKTPPPILPKPNKKELQDRIILYDEELTRLRNEKSSIYEIAKIMSSDDRMRYIKMQIPELDIQIENYESGKAASIEQLRKLTIKIKYLKYKTKYLLLLNNNI